MAFLLLQSGKKKEEKQLFDYKMGDDFQSISRAIFARLFFINLFVSIRLEPIATM